MGIFDSASNAIKGAAAGTGRATKAIQLKAQLNEVAKQRATSAAQLGASLFEETRANPQFRASREDIYGAIEALDAQRDALQAELTQIEQEGQAAQQAAMTCTCPKCGGRVGATDSFCVGCGTPIADIKKSLNLCPQCGTPLESDAAFCVGCGTPVAAIAGGQETAPQNAPAAGRVCSNCGTALEDDALFCVSCGIPVAKDESDASEVETSAGAASTDQIENDVVADTSTEEVMVSEEAVVAEVEKVEEAVSAEASVADIPGLCPQCGYENIDTAKFCYNCGNAIK